MNNRSRLQQVLSEKRVSTAQLAEAIGLSVRSIHNVSCRGGKNRSAKQRITEFLQVCVWEDCPFHRRIVLEPGDEVDFLSEKKAEQWEAALGDRVHRVGRSVTLRKPVDLVLHESAAAAPVGGQTSSFDRRVNLLRRELAVRAEDFNSGRLSIAEAKEVHRTTGKKLTALRRECAKMDDPVWPAQIKLLATIRQILRVQIHHAEANATAKNA